MEVEIYKLIGDFIFYGGLMLIVGFAGILLERKFHKPEDIKNEERIPHVRW